MGTRVPIRRIIGAMSDPRPDGIENPAFPVVEFNKHPLSDQQAAAMVLSAYVRWDPGELTGSTDENSLMLQLEQALVRSGYVKVIGALTEAGEALLREHG